MFRETRPEVKLEDLNVGKLGLKSWEKLTPSQWKSRMDDMHWMLEIMYCSRVLGGLEYLDWEVAKTMTFPQYMDEVKAHAALAG